MLPFLKQRLQALEETREDLLRELEELTEEQLRFQPGDGMWSILNVVEHLVIAEEKTNDAILKNLPNLHEARKTGLPSAVKSGLLTLVLRSPLRVKVPSKAVLPTGSPDFGALRQRWRQARTQLEIILAEFLPEKLSYPVMKHPVGGPFNIRQTLRFIREHIAHHRQQIARIRRTPGFPT